jgi:hypothetical protein
LRRQPPRAFRWRIAERIQAALFASSSQAERAELIASLEAAEARIAAEQFVEHEPDRFVDRLLEARASAVVDRA